MFRSDRDALAQEVDELRREREALLAQNEAMRSDLLERRRNMPAPAVPANVYKQGLAKLSKGERAALLQNDVKAFPVWAALLLHFVTFGLFSLVHFSRLHDKLPHVDREDPTARKAIGFTFIPYFYLYWIVFNTLRLTDRINLQFRLRGMHGPVPRSLMMLTAILTIVPYLNIIFAFVIAWPVAIYFLQRAVNQLAAISAEGTPRVETARSEAAVRVRRMRVPLVKDLAGPDDVAEAEIEAAAVAEASARRAR